MQTNLYKNINKYFSKTKKEKKKPEIKKISLSEKLAFIKMRVSRLVIVDLQKHPR